MSGAELQMLAVNLWFLDAEFGGLVRSIAAAVVVATVAAGVVVVVRHGSDVVLDVAGLVVGRIVAPAAATAWLWLWLWVV